ncbi:MAG: type sorting protein [Fibrobacteres bacterium]|nr:type sorting protein [Fibrobacterota bacterium]
MVLLGLSFASAQLGALFHVNCGGEAFADKNGHFWESDAHFEGGSTFSSDSAILNTDMPALYQTERWNDTAKGALKYTFNVRPGAYKISLHYAEIFTGAFALGKRVFDVKINDSIVAADMDIFAQAGANTPLVLDYLTNDVDGKITVGFTDKVLNAKISGIEVIPQNPYRATAAPYRIHCGGEDYIDPQGNYWEGDGHYSNGATYASANVVANTDKSILYQTERYNGSNDLVYAFDVAEGAYDVKLHFAEIFFQTAGQRVFSIDINGASAAENFDIAAEAGPNTALVKEFTANAVDGKITIGFRNGVENAKISGIEIMEASPTRNRIATGAKLSDGFAVKALGAGALSIRSSAPGSFTALVLDVHGRQVAFVKGSGNQAVSGLRPGLYVVKVQASGRTVSRRIPVL